MGEKGKTVICLWSKMKMGCLVVDNRSKALLTAL
jgi:hypothetical protein